MPASEVFLSSNVTRREIHRRRGQARLLNFLAWPCFIARSVEFGVRAFPQGRPLSHYLLDGRPTFKLDMIDI